MGEIKSHTEGIFSMERFVVIKNGGGMEYQPNTRKMDNDTTYHMYL